MTHNRGYNKVLLLLLVRVKSLMLIGYMTTLQCFRLMKDLCNSLQILKIVRMA
jgi:hypothetical protein